MDLYSIEDLDRIAKETLGVIERDAAQVLTERQKKVLIFWMRSNMLDVRNNAVYACAEKTEKTRHDMVSSLVRTTI
jgi:hypothetical protein